MLRYCAILFVALSASSGNLFGPKYPPTRGNVWPQPKHQTSENAYYKFSPEYFNITVTGETCDILTRAIERYLFLGRDSHRLFKRTTWTKHERRRRLLESNSNQLDDAGYIQQLQVDLTAPCETLPYFGMDESYNLTVETTSRLKSASIWGILRGLETWTQLFYFVNDQTHILINKTTIHDAPRYPHRGLLIDTSRHYLSLATITRTLDAMAMNKMNVLHWHIVDDQSFPYQSKKFPDLSRLGAYHSSMVYSKESIELVINYATDRGIRVLPEFDVPGHTRSWGQAYPNILTRCYSGGVAAGLGPMNPINNDTYQFLRELFAEVNEWFPDKYFHIGGDEVDLGCWESNPELWEYMKEHNMPSASNLHALFMEKVIPLLGRKSEPIVWQEVFDERVPLSKDTLIHVWKGDEIHEMMNILTSGYKLLYSSAWYLDHLKSGADWESFYAADPRHMVEAYRSQFDEDAYNLDNIVGGEACMWGEDVDDNNFMSRVWPRASAVAEKLWSPGPSTRVTFGIPSAVYSRLSEHVCRMNRRQVRAQPSSGPGYCLGGM